MDLVFVILLVFPVFKRESIPKLARLLQAAVKVALALAKTPHCSSHGSSPNQSCSRSSRDSRSQSSQRAPLRSTVSTRSDRRRYNSSSSNGSTHANSHPPMDVAKVKGANHSQEGHGNLVTTSRNIPAASVYLHSLMANAKTGDNSTNGRTLSDGPYTPCDLEKTIIKGGLSSPVAANPAEDAAVELAAAMQASFGMKAYRVICHLQCHDTLSVYMHVQRNIWTPPEPYQGQEVSSYLKG